MKRWLVLSVLLAGCGSPTQPDTVTLSALGTWRYDAHQSSPAFELSGQLRIDQQNGSRIEGHLEAQETDVHGTVRNRVGIVSGRVLSDGAVDFDVFFESTARRHVGQIRADSIAGSWAQVVGGSAPISGSFSAHRMSQ